jgi:hypothetical protein
VIIAACGSPRPGGGDGPPGDDAGGDGPPSNGDGPPIDAAGTGIDGSLACPIGQWCIETSPVANVTLRSVFAVNAGDVFAVGSAGTILRRQADVWTQMTSNTTVDLKGVWGASSDDVWAVGLGGTMLHWNGTAWTLQAGIPVLDLEAMWGSGPNDVWVAATGAVLHYNGQGWTQQNLTGSLYSISGTGPTDVWVTGENAKIHHYNGAWDPGGSINPFGSGGTNNFFAIFALAANNVWATAAIVGKETLNFTGGAGAWTPHATSVTIFQSIWGRTANDLWGAGQSGKVGHYDGNNWTIEPQPGVTNQLFFITGAVSAGTTHMWIVGDGATILHRN